MNTSKDIAVWGGFDSSGLNKGESQIDKPYDIVVNELLEKFPDLILGYDSFADMQNSGTRATYFFKCAYTGVLEEGQCRAVGYIVETSNLSACMIQYPSLDKVKSYAEDPLVYETKNYITTLTEVYNPGPLIAGNNTIVGKGKIVSKNDSVVVMEGDIMIQM